MSLFQKAVLNKYLKSLETEKVAAAYEKFRNHFHNPTIQENIRNSKEEQYQGEFLIDLFVNVLGYTKNPTPNFNLTTELKNIKDSKKTDGAILSGENALAVIELKGTNTTDLSKIETQAFGYKNNQTGCNYVITSNFEKLRFYIDNAVDFEEFNLFQLSKERFNILWLCLAADYLLKDIPKKIKDESLTQEENITKKLYKNYSEFRNELFDSIQKENSEYDKLTLFKKTQKLLDRFLFIFFAEDRLLLPPNSIRAILQQWTDLKEKYDEYQPLYNRFKKYFGYMNTGFKGKQHDIFAYNGGLFASDDILDNIKINDELLYKHTLNLSNYNFESEVSVNILGHIFEHSLTEIETIQAQLAGTEIDQSKSKRKKDGVFYTPKYITKYIVNNTISKLCEEKKTILGIDDEEYAKGRKNRKKETIKRLDANLKTYRNWLLNLSICDPACGSGAFLNQALEFLMEEHQYIDELESQLLGYAFDFPGVENAILENNLFGVDINEESVEIAKLSLWLRTAQKGRKLTSLNNNIKCGNSLIDDPKVAGDKAFKWQQEFPQIFKAKKLEAYHVVLTTHNSRTSQRMRERKIQKGKPLVWNLQEEIALTKIIGDIIKENGYKCLAYNICKDHVHLILVCEYDELHGIVQKTKSISSKLFHRLDIPMGHDPLEHKNHLWSQKFFFADLEVLKPSEISYRPGYCFKDAYIDTATQYIKNNRVKHDLPKSKKLENIIAAFVLTQEEAFKEQYKGGFDVVIGNPPYLVVKGGRWIGGFQYDKEAINYLKDNFVTASQQINTYVLFIELGLILSKTNGYISQITPNTFLANEYSQKLREYLIEKSSVIELFNSGLVFDDASVETSVLTYKNTINYSTNTKIKLSLFDKGFSLNLIEICKLTDDSKFLININEKTLPLLQKLNLFERVNKYAKVWRGLTTGNDKEYLSHSKLNENYKPIISGSEVERYYHLPNNKFVNYIPERLDRPRDKRIFLLDNKLISKFVGNRLTFCLDDKQHYVVNTACSTEVIDKNIDSHFLLSILNSSLINFYFHQVFSDTRSTFPIMKSGNIEDLPFKYVDLKLQLPYIDKAKYIILQSNKLSILITKTLDLIQAKYNFDKLSNKLQNWHKLEFGEFLKELKKQKVPLSLKEEAEWMPYFNEQKEKAQTLKTEIDKTDNEIDQMVYKLYGLTAEEIAIVEEATT